MCPPDPAKLIRLLTTLDRVYDLETDSLIRQAGNSMTAAAMFRVFGALDDQSPEFTERLRELCTAFGQGNLSALIGIDDGRWDHLPEGDDPEEVDDTANAVKYCFKLTFPSSEIAHCLWGYVPDMDAPYITGGSRKVVRNIQFAHIGLSHPKYLQLLLENIRECLYLEQIEELTEEDFYQAIR